LGRTVGSFQNSEQADTDWVTVIESNIDNMTGELLGGLMDKLFAAGALDVNYTPIQMKKNRPAVMLTIICQVDEGSTMAELLLSESSTLGVRISQVQRLKAQRLSERIDTPVGPILVKVKRLGKHIINATPEYEECRRIAQEKGLPLEDVYEIARQVFETRLLAHKYEIL
jgi:pyridinium-3,5-bisthiocarboxylic acid mononucleotide nickel chelatase